MGRYHNIVLVGFMGTGKTTVGKLIAERLGWRFADTDALITAQTGRTVQSIFSEDGEPAFRAMETAMCVEVSTWRRTVIATGGGAWIAPTNRAILCTTGFAVCLRAPLEQIEARLLESDEVRPLLNAPDRRQRIADLMNARSAIYATVPRAVDTGGLTPYAVCDRVIAMWRAAN
jgi:shikimate kinase